jgi:hypothetical protein
LPRVGYITDEIMTTIVYFAARMNKPILLGGTAGVAQASGVGLCVCFDGVSEEKAVGRFDAIFIGLVDKFHLAL